ncbi:14721_t:CDS:1, partial [Gigaspora margarita]
MTKSYESQSNILQSIPAVVKSKCPAPLDIHSSRKSFEHPMFCGKRPGDPKNVYKIVLSKSEFPFIYGAAYHYLGYWHKNGFGYNKDEDTAKYYFKLAEP